MSAKQLIIAVLLCLAAGLPGAHADDPNKSPHQPPVVTPTPSVTPQVRPARTGAARASGYEEKSMGRMIGGAARPARGNDCPVDPNKVGGAPCDPHPQ